jgi:RHS repeat-associated protein
VLEEYKVGITLTMTKYYFVGGSYEIQDDGATQTTLKYYSFAGMMVAMDDGTDLVYFANDHLSSASLVMDETGTLQSENRYMPFGEVREITGVTNITETDFGYTGQRNLADISLMDYQARFYSPTLGKFVQPDSIVPDTVNPQSFNRYSYVMNSPIMFIDPTGNVCTNGMVQIPGTNVCTDVPIPSMPASHPNSVPEPPTGTVPLTDGEKIALWALYHLSTPEGVKGNDCTNYASQALAFGGGVPTDATWYPGSDAWISTPEYYNWLLNTYESWSVENIGVLNVPGLNEDDEWTFGLLNEDENFLNYLEVNGDQITEGSMVFYLGDPKHFDSWTHVAIVVGFEYDPKTGLNVPLIVEHSGPYGTDYESLPRLIYETDNDNIASVDIIIIP